MIEIIKDHCPACMYTKFNTNNLSLKLDKHQLLDKVPFYRMKITNQVPWLGDFAHTPMHFYIKKEQNEIVEIKLLNSPLQQEKCNKFLSELKEKTGIEDFDERIKYDFMGQWTKFINQQDLQNDHDFDFDAKAGYESVSERKKREEAEQQKKKQE